MYDWASMDQLLQVMQGRVDHARAGSVDAAQVQVMHDWTSLEQGPWVMQGRVYVLPVLRNDLKIQHRTHDVPMQVMA